MTHPPATCELCGGTGLYSPSALPCPKGCSAEDIVDRLNEIWSTDDHERGCQGREYSCSCGFDDRTFATAKSAAEYITNMRTYISEMDKRLEYATEIVIANEGLGAALSEAEQREKDALELVSAMAEKANDELIQKWHSDLGATPDTQACGIASHIINDFRCDVEAALLNNDKRALKDEAR